MCPALTSDWRQAASRQQGCLVERKTGTRGWLPLGLRMGGGPSLAHEAVQLAGEPSYFPSTAAGPPGLHARRGDSGGLRPSQTQQLGPCVSRGRPWRSAGAIVKTQGYPVPVPAKAVWRAFWQVCEPFVCDRVARQTALGPAHSILRHQGWRWRSCWRTNCYTRRWFNGTASVPTRPSLPQP